VGRAVGAAAKRAAATAGRPQLLWATTKTAARWGSQPALKINKNHKGNRAEDLPSDIHQLYQLSYSISDILHE
jgi:hypothetical protein